QLVPAHVRHLAVGIAREAHHPSAEDAEPGHAGRLLALVEEDLHPDTDAEERPPRSRRLAHGLDQPRGREVLHAGAEGALPRQHARRCGGDALGVAGDLGRLAEALEGLLRAAQVADAVVDDGERPRHPSRVPFVESTPRTRGSRCVAWSRARASPLNAASTMWCGLRPASMRTCRFMPAWLVSAGGSPWTARTRSFP